MTLETGLVVAVGSLAAAIVALWRRTESRLDECERWRRGVCDFLLSGDAGSNLDRYVATAKNKPMKPNTKTWLAVLVLVVIAVLSASTLFAQAPATNAPPATGPGMELDVFSAMWKQVANSPASLLLIPVFAVLAWLIETSWVNSKIIPWVCIGGCAAVYPLFCSKSSVPNIFPSPLAVLIANGILCGFLAYVAHSQIIMRIVSAIGRKPNT